MALIKPLEIGILCNKIFGDGKKGEYAKYPLASTGTYITYESLKGFSKLLIP